MSPRFPPRIDRGLGGPPRIPPLTDAQITGRSREAIDNTRNLFGVSHAEPVPVFFATLCRHADMFERYMAFGMNILHNSALQPRERELIILRTGWLCDAPFEWGEHVVLGLEAGLTRDEVEAIKRGSAASDWAERDRALLTAVEQLHHTAMICDETWAVLECHFDERQLIELPFVVGQYHMTAYVQNALRFRPGRDKHGEVTTEEQAA